MIGSDNLYFVALSGGASIGASCYLVRCGETAVLIDCGIHPDQEPSDTFELLVKRAKESGLVESLADISAFVLTHAHADHSGLVPALYRYCRSQSTRIPYFYMTKATKYLLQHVFRNILRFSSRIPYTEKDVHELFQHICTPEEGGTELDWLWPQLGWVRLHHNSHLLGSVMVELKIKNRTLLYTGDLRMGDSPVLKASPIPECRPEVVILDGTYGASDARHILSWDAVRDLAFKLLDETLAKGYVVLLPCFAMGRAQDVLGLVLEYAELHPELPFYVYLDGQSRDITMEIITSFGDMLRAEFNLLIQRNRSWRLRRVDPDNSLEELVNTEIVGYPSVIIASSGMLLPGSASRRWAEQLASRSNAAIILTGYLDEEIQEELFVLKALGGRPLTLPVNALPISGHVSADQTMEFVNALSPSSAIIVHCGTGNLRGPGSLLAKLRSAGVFATIADDGQVITVRPAKMEDK